MCENEGGHDQRCGYPDAIGDRSEHRVADWHRDQRDEPLVRVDPCDGPRRAPDATTTSKCSCDQRARTAAEPLGVYVETDQAADGPPVFRVGLTHARCPLSRMVRRPGLIEKLLAAAFGQPGGTRAYFRIRDRHPPAVLICRPYLQAIIALAVGRPAGRHLADGAPGGVFRAERVEPDAAELAGAVAVAAGTSPPRAARHERRP